MTNQEDSNSRSRKPTHSGQVSYSSLALVSKRRNFESERALWQPQPIDFSDIQGITPPAGPPPPAASIYRTNPRANIAPAKRAAPTPESKIPKNIGLEQALMSLAQCQTLAREFVPIAAQLPDVETTDFLRQMIQETTEHACTLYQTANQPHSPTIERLACAAISTRLFMQAACDMKDLGLDPARNDVRLSAFRLGHNASKALIAIANGFCVVLNHTPQDPNLYLGLTEIGTSLDSAVDVITVQAAAVADIAAAAQSAAVAAGEMSVSADAEAAMLAEAAEKAAELAHAAAEKAQQARSRQSALCALAKDLAPLRNQASSAPKAEQLLQTPDTCADLTTNLLISAKALSRLDVDLIDARLDAAQAAALITLYAFNQFSAAVIPEPLTTDSAALGSDHAAGH